MTHLSPRTGLALTLGLAATCLAGSAFAANPKVAIETTEGTIVAELYEQKAPKTVENFLKYVEEDHYDGTIFHRVIEGFMVQGGGFTKDMKEKETRSPIQNEANSDLPNEKYTLAMARTANPDSATNQFFINTVTNPHLDRRAGFAGYAVFGKVIEGQDVVEAIESVRTQSVPGPRGHLMKDVPVEPTVIKEIKVVDQSGSSS